MATIATNPDGSITWTGNVTFTGATDPLSTGVATLTLTPSGGVSNLPALVNGTPGMPPTFRNITVTTLDPTVTPTPTQSATLTLVSPGGAGVASIYDLNLSLLKGTPGTPGATGHILGSSDFSNSPANGQVPVYNSSNSLVAWTTLTPIAAPYFTIPGTAFTALNETASGVRDIVVSTTIPAQTFRYRPIVSGDLEVTGAVGMRIDAEVRMGPQTTATTTTAISGTLIGYGRGTEPISATTPLPGHLNITPYFGVAMAPSDTTPAAAVPAGQAQTIALVAVRQYGSSAWTTSQTLGELRVRLEAI